MSILSTSTSLISHAYIFLRKKKLLKILNALINYHKTGSKRSYHFLPRGEGMVESRNNSNKLWEARDILISLRGNINFFIFDFTSQKKLET